MARVGVVFGGRSVEHRVSVVSARTVAAALGAAGHAVEPLAIAEDGVWVNRERGKALLAGERDALPAADDAVRPSLARLLEAEIDVAFPLVHGTWGEDGSLQGLFEIADLPYVGADVTASAVAMDKRLTKEVLRGAGLPVVEYAAVRRSAWEEDPEAALVPARELPLPLFVKPSVGGSSVGIHKVRDATLLPAAVEHALEFDEVALIERAIRGRELECSVLGYRSLEASRVGEIVPGAEFYDYEDKYVTDAAQLAAPAELAPELEAELQRLAVAGFEAIGGSGMARVDFLVEGGETPWINEINTLPGFTAISMYPKLWEASGVPLPELVDRLVHHAFERHRDRHRLDRGIKAWLARYES